MNYSDIERKLNDTASHYEVVALRSHVDRLECSVRELSAVVDGLCSALTTAQEMISLLNREQQ